MTTQSETNESFYNRISHSYDGISNANEHKAREAGEKALALEPGERVFELGFGTGNSLINLANLVGPTGHVSGLDVSQGMLDVSLKKLTEQNLADRVDLKIGDGRKLPYEDGSFDAAFASFTLELFPLEDIPAVLAEFRRILKPGGRVGFVSMATVKPDQKARMLEKTYVWMHRHFPHIVDCQPIDVVQVVKDGGFEIEQEIDMEIWTMPVRAVIGRCS